ncbi:hypothetical protein ACUN0C_07420 [Faunimonas sp. B44]|uniref:hypothetical protein n=1 Tax=Faunimonas sp. B44 TaxID=3461493 RepID=UPI004043A672
MTDGAPEPLRGRIRHRIPGRIRIAIEPPLQGEAALARFADAVSGIETVEAVEIRPSTCSLLIRHGGCFEAIVRALADRDLLLLSEPGPAAPLDPIAETLAGLDRAEATVMRLTGGRGDLWSLAFAGLVAGGFVQLARGRVAGPALTLFGQAATIAASRALRPRR